VWPYRYDIVEIYYGVRGYVVQRILHLLGKRTVCALERPYRIRTRAHHNHRESRYIEFRIKFEIIERREDTILGSDLGCGHRATAPPRHFGLWLRNALDTKVRRPQRLGRIADLGRHRYGSRTRRGHPRDVISRRTAYRHVFST